MRRCLIGLVVVAVLSACSDSIPTSTTGPKVNHPLSIVVTGSLDDNITNLINLWPQGIANAIQKRWDQIKKEYDAGQLNNQQLQAAIKHLFDLTGFINNKTPNMGNPPNDESKNAAASRLVLYMFLYVFDGPGTTPPPYFPGADDAVGLLRPNAPLTLVTPSGDAGVHFDRGSVGEERVIIITQNPNPYFECNGPLFTTLCQYPLFYDIQSFPDGPLLKLGQAQICHVPTGEPYGPPDEATHNNLRLAHTAPDDPDNYTPGSTVLKDEGNNIEILPLISQTFVQCNDVVYNPPEQLGLLGRGVYLAEYLAKRAARWILPASAFAIDQGGGGAFESFSPFNDVDTTPIIE